MKKQVTTKIPQEIADKIAEMATNSNKFASDIYAQAIENHVTGATASPQHSEAFEKMQSEINQLQNTLKLISEENTALKADRETALNYIADLEAREPQTIEKEVIKEIPAQLSENDILIKVPPHIAHFLNDTIKAVEKQQGKKTEPGQLLLNLFWAYITQGPGDHLPIIYKPAEIRRVIEMYKNSQA